MKKLFCKKALCGLLVLILAISTCVFASAADVANGSCGGNITWKLDSNGKLTISGSGAMSYLLLSDANVKKVKTVSVSNGITEICYAAFEGFTNLTSVSLPASITTIDSSAFKNCTSLGSITLPANLTYIGSSSFENCKKLSSITIPSKVTATGMDTFKGCTSLTSVTIPASIAEINSGLFDNCTKLATVTLGCKMAELDFAFNFIGCTSLTTFIVPASNPSISAKDGVVFNKAGTELMRYPIGKSGSYSIPGNVTEINRFAFNNCSKLTSLTIPEGIEDIWYNTFTGCTSLKSVSLPRSLTLIQSKAFYDCPLTAVTLSERISYIADDAFGSGVVITAPEDSYAAKWAKEHHYTLITTAREYTVQVSCIDKYGTASATPACGKAGTQVTLKATANKGYKFTGWTVVKGGVTIKNNKFTLGKSDVLIRANFEVDKSSAVVKGLQYKLDGKKKTAILVRPESAAVSSVTIPATIKAYGTKYKVVEIAANAFKGCASLTKVTIGAEITKIGKNAFNGCKKLKTVTIKTTKLTKKGIGSGSFKNISAKATFKLPGKQKKDYQTWLVKTGKAPKKAKFK